MELLEFTLAPGQNRRFERAGTYLEVIDASGRLNIELTGRSGELADDMRNALSGFYSGEQFAGFEVANAEAYAQSVILMIANKPGGSRRQPGSVRIIDSSADKTAAGLQYMGQAGRAAAGAGVFSMIGLLAGARRVAIRRITVSSSIAGPVYFGFGSGIPTTNYSSSGNGISKLYSGAITTAQASRWNATAANSPPVAADVPGVQGAGQWTIPASLETELLAPAQTPIILGSAGAVFWLHSAIANRDLSANFDFEELTT